MIFKIALTPILHINIDLPVVFCTTWHVKTDVSCQVRENNPEFVIMRSSELGHLEFGIAHFMTESLQTWTLDMVDVYQSEKV